MFRTRVGSPSLLSSVRKAVKEGPTSAERPEFSDECKSSGDHLRVYAWYKRFNYALLCDQCHLETATKSQYGIIFLLNWDSEPCFYGENTKKQTVIDFEFNRPALAMFYSSWDISSLSGVIFTVEELMLTLHYTGVASIFYFWELLHMGLAIFLCDGPNSKDLMLCTSVSVIATQLCHRGMKVATDNEKTKEGGSLPVTFYLWALWFEFYIIFTCRKIFFLFFFLNI